MNKFKKYISALFILLMTVLSSFVTAFAEETEADLFNNNTPQDIAVFIEYEHNDISFKLISPSGVEITKDTDTENITVFSGSKSTVIFLGSAETGQWKIKYDKGSNENINISASVQDSSFWITSFDVKAVTDNKIPVTFNVSSGKTSGYNYSLILTTDKESLNGKTLATGSGVIGEDVTTEVSLEDVSTHSGYYLLLYVSYMDNDSEIFDYSYSNAFDYTNPNAPESIDKADITISHDTLSVTADWKNYIGYDTDSVFVEYYIDNQLISSTEYPVSAGYSGFFTYKEDSKVLTLKVSVKNKNGLASDFKSFDIEMSDDKSMSLTLPESGKTGSEIWSFDYKGADDTEITFNVNGKVNEYTVSGDGSKYLTLTEDRNTIKVSYTDENGYTHVYNRMANISRTAPTLELIKSLDGVTTANDTIIISGKTSASVLTVNDKEIDINNGIFSYVYELKNGKNSIVLTASTGDSSTSLTATVTKESSGILTEGSDDFRWIIPLATGLLISAVGIVLIILLTKKHEKKKNAASQNMDIIKPQKPKKVKKPKKVRKPGFILLISLIICWTVTVLTWVWFIIRKIFENSTGYIELAYESLKSADSYLFFTTFIMITAIVITVIALVLTIIFIIVRITKNPKRQQNQMMYQTMQPTIQPTIQEPANYDNQNQ